jgi:hypothetical protein
MSGKVRGQSAELRCSGDKKHRTGAGVGAPTSAGNHPAVRLCCGMIPAAGRRKKSFADFFDKKVVLTAKKS